MKREIIRTVRIYATAMLNRISWKLQPRETIHISELHTEVDVSGKV